MNTTLNYRYLLVFTELFYMSFLKVVVPLDGAQYTYNVRA